MRLLPCVHCMPNGAPNRKQARRAQRAQLGGRAHRSGQRWSPRPGQTAGCSRAGKASPVRRASSTSATSPCKAAAQAVIASNTYAAAHLSSPAALTAWRKGTAAGSLASAAERQDAWVGWLLPAGAEGSVKGHPNPEARATRQPSVTAARAARMASSLVGQRVVGVEVARLLVQDRGGACENASCGQ